MTTTDPLGRFGTNITPQRQPIPGRSEQVKNNAGGYVFEIDKLTQFTRFLTIGTAGGTYYVGQDALTVENGNMILELTKNEADQIDAIDILVEISEAGRAPKQNPTLFALAIFCQHGTTAAKQHARKQITKVVRTGTHLFIFVGYLKQFGGWSRGLRKAVGNWYVEKNADQLSYQLVKYRQREGFTHRDILRMTHPKVEEPLKRAVINWAVKGSYGEADDAFVPAMPSVLEGYTKAQVPLSDIPKLLSWYKLPWEALPDSAMNDPKVWDVMIDNGIPVHALIRQLPRLTNLGMLPQIGGRTNEIVDTLTSRDALRKARVHPIQALIALKTYSSGQGFRNSWSPTTKIIDALDEMFYASFGAIQATEKRTLLACDISYSMTAQAGGTLLTAAEVAAAMSLTTMSVEPNANVVGFSSISGRQTREPKDSKLIDLNISSRQRLDDVMRSMWDRNRPFGGTDCALPMVAALKNGWHIDTFVIYTDNETWHGDIHPVQALKQYRQKSGIDARLIIVAVTATNFSIADPTDPGMLDICGFDAATPNLISDFSATVI